MSNLFMTREFALRVLSSVMIIALGAVVLLWNYPVLFYIACLSSAGIASYEYYTLCLKQKIKIEGLVLFFLVLIFFGFLLASMEINALLILIAFSLILATGFFYLFRTQLKHSNYYILFLFWILIPHLLFYSLSYIDGGRMHILFLVTTVTATDTLAYIGGNIFGRHKLIPKVSPNKTIEGFLCGLLGAGLSAVIFSLFLDDTFSFWSSLILGVVLAVSAQIGDILESHFKRLAKEKDSGFLIPGHGGLLDRLDGYLTVIWVYAIYLIV